MSVLLATLVITSCQGSGELRDICPHNAHWCPANVKTAGLELNIKGVARL